MSSRVIVKNLPQHASEERLRERFSAFGEVTDCKLKSTKDGRSRGFAFVGFRRVEEAEEAIRRLNRSFFDTARLSVEPAHAPGAQGAARPWSRYTVGSSAFARLHDHGDDDVSATLRPTKIGVIPTALSGAGAKQKTRRLAARGAKKSAASDIAALATEKSVEPEYRGDTGATEATVAKRISKNKLAFDDDLDDLAYLRRKAEEGPAAAEQGAVAPAMPKKNLKQRKLKAAKEADVGHSGTSDHSSASARRPVPAEAGIANGDADEGEDADASGRLYVRNFSYSATEDELRTHFEAVGQVSTVQICKDEDTQKSRGFGYVTYVFPECALRAQAVLDLQSFQGRVLRVSAAKAKPALAEVDLLKGITKLKSSYKKRLEARRKKVDAHLQHTWNLLYVSANAAVNAATAQLGVAKAELIGKDAENAALTAALTETSVIQQTKLWLRKEGIRVEAFEQAGPSLAKSKAVEGSDAKRRDDTFIVKHLPAGTVAHELQERFSRYGEVLRCSMAPSGTVAIVQYTESAHAKRAFSKLAFSRYRHVPLFLEWAPADCFLGGAAKRDAGHTSCNRQANDKDDGEERGPAETSTQRGCLFVKNLNFATTEEVFKSVFSRCRGFRSATIMTKKAALRDKDPTAKSRNLSMGYGFVEFDTPANASDALRRKQNVVVDDHALKLQISQRGAQQVGQRMDTGPSNRKSIVKTQKLCVRNLAFETTRKELQQLFGAYGSVTAVRLPKKSDYTGHRGFAFVDFASKSEAAAALEALQHTHLYGRRLVIEVAEEAATDVGAIQQVAEKRKAAKDLRSEAKRRRRAGVLNAPGEAGSFEEAVML